MSEFEVLRFEAVPVTGRVAVVELDGDFGGPRPARRPVLVVERRDRTVEAPAADVVEEPWSASFAVPIELALDPRAEWGLSFGRGPLFALPSPTTVAEEDRYVRLARQANELRHRISEQAVTVAEAEAHEAAVAREHERVRVEQAAEHERAREALAAEHATAVRELEEARAELARVTESLEASERT
ncbi:MAG TPA: hypothetical protein VN238_11050, partial [Solirubrobacteraceae bacterium]|nr:hypothetical protein [Solirubrobacteraceae bacterium]